MAKFDANKFKRDLQAAQRKAQADAKRQVDAINRKNQQVVDDYNRKVRASNQRAVNSHNQQVAAQNREIQRVNTHNVKVVANLNKQLRSASTVRSTYTPDEQALTDRVQEALVARDEREWDVFLSYARIDGEATAQALCESLESLGVRVWFDALAIVPGKSQSLQMDQGLRKARAGVVLLTPAYLVGRFWTERELGALLHKSTLIPVLHQSTFDQVAEYSGMLPDLAGFETARDPIEVIAEKIAAAVLPAGGAE
ncbi:toll/interleukin-1 receptor domain-containing protein [Conyzicola nivalis]|uniref:toll/interleukin-1 receptor domain-containing protein n=1 Tax=Conyzicola nivalis TaxID=1477021 RepID=UPI0033963532